MMFFNSKKRRIALVIIIFSLMFQGCTLIILDLLLDDYPKRIDISGHVKCNKTKDPIPGIHITIPGSENDFTRTDKNGYFELRCRNEKTITIQFEDVDGTFNKGLFKTKVLDIKARREGEHKKDIGNIYLEKYE